MTAARCSEADAALQADVLAAARRWIGTPYRHQASLKGVGADCLGLLRGIWREVMGTEPELPPPYTPDWSEASGEERLLAAAQRHLFEVPMLQAGPGDVGVMRMHPSGPAKHVVILAGRVVAESRIIHAYSGHHVCETVLGHSWARRIVATFRFPERND